MPNCTRLHAAIASARHRVPYTSGFLRQYLANTSAPLHFLRRTSLNTASTDASTNIAFPQHRLSLSFNTLPNHCNLPRAFPTPAPRLSPGRCVLVSERAIFAASYPAQMTARDG